ncbi:hypothetical protein OMK64_12970 [Cellulomonas fimi]|uniref:hypothetical protein n=1 Tax=Cellulomonas fimi TaxID=1708 RepID=UPI00234DAA31|nr:hypothetical protein [Cellulomonas fimi]MDC7122445.1 hypothetical protein [Cellulomonas fimi]
MTAPEGEAALEIRHGRRNRRSGTSRVAGRLTVTDGVLRYEDVDDGRRSFAVPIGDGPRDADALVHVHSALLLSTGSAPDPEWECLLVLDHASAVVGQVGGWSTRTASPLEVDLAALRRLTEVAGLELRYDRDPAAVLRARYPGARFGGLRPLEAFATAVGLLVVAAGAVLVTVAAQEPSWFGLVLAAVGVVSAGCGVVVVPAVQRTAQRLRGRRPGRRARGSRVG